MTPRSSWFLETLPLGWGQLAGFPPADGTVNPPLRRSGGASNWPISNPLEVRRCPVLCDLQNQKSTNWGCQLIDHSEKQFLTIQHESFLAPNQEGVHSREGHSVTKLLFVELKFPQVCCRNESQNSIAVDLLHSRDKERKKESEVAPSCLTLWDPMDCSLPDSSRPEHWSG